MNNLTAIYWIKNEARYLPEYIEFHLLQGFDKFIFYDNNSTDNLLDVIKPYKDLIEIRYYPKNLDLGHTNRPMGSKNFYVMEYCIKEQCGKSKWIHFHAIDERLFCPDGKTVVEFLKEYEQFSGVSVCWKEFNSNGHLSRPNGLLIENYTETVGDPLNHIKTIIQPCKAIRTIGTPHNFVFGNGFAVNENYQEVSTSFCSNYSYKRIRLNHYRTLSKEEFDEKMNKGVLDWKHTEDTVRSSKQLEWDTAHDIERGIGIDTELLKYVDVVRNNIKERYKNNEHLLEFINH